MTDEGTIQRDVEFLTGSGHRSTVLAQLCAEPMRPADLCDRVEATRTTIQRILAGFRDRSWVEKRDGCYHATVTGHRVNERFQELRTAVEQAHTFAPLASDLSDLDEQLPPEAFETGTVTPATDQEPLAAVDRIVEWLREDPTAHVQTFTPIVARSFNETVAEMLATGLTVEMVIDEGVLERSAAQFQQALERGRDHGGVSVSVAPAPLEDGLMVRSDSAAVAAYDESNNVRALAESGDDAVIEWATERFEQVQSRAVPLSDVLSDGQVGEHSGPN